MRTGTRERLWGCVVALVAAACSTEGEKTYSRDRLLKPETCKECHEDHYREWSGSMHAYASEDPVFRAMNARGQRETGGALGDFCVKCHAPMAVSEGATVDGTDLDEVPEELQGITCYFCHNAASVEGTHNNPIQLANDVTMRGNVGDPVRSRAHASGYSALLDSRDVTESSKLCGSCHDIVVPKALHGGSEDVHLERTYTEWQGSLFNVGEQGRLSCAKCHMEQVSNVPIASAPGVLQRSSGRHLHDFPGVDVALTPFPEADSQRERVERSLDTSIRVKLCVDQGGGISLDLENIAAGHNMPSGASQDRRLWVELRAFETPGDATPSWTAGVPPDDGSIDTIEGEKNTWVFRDHGFDVEGNETHMFWNVARTEPGTILAPNVIRPGVPHQNVTSKTYTWVPVSKRVLPDRILVTLKMTPIARAVLDDLMTHDDLSAALAAEIPTFTLLPNRPLGEAVTLEWTFDTAKRSNSLLCAETAAGP